MHALLSVLTVAFTAEPFLWEPIDLYEEVGALTRDERWSDAVDRLLAEPLPQNDGDRARAALLASVTRLDPARGKRETDAFLKTKPRPSADLITLLALQDRCARVPAMARAIEGADAPAAQLVAIGCLVRLGRGRAALAAFQAWKETLAGSDDIERTTPLALAWSIPRDDGDDFRRAALARARTDPDAWAEVLAVDCRFESEGPFGPQLDPALLERDLAFATVMLRNDAPRLDELRRFAESCRDEDWSYDTLPTSARLLMLALTHLRPPEDDEARSILARFGAELERRASAGDAAAWQVLVELELQVGDPTPRAAFGWERFHAVRAGEMLLADETLAFDSAKARAIIAQLPSSYLVASVRRQRATASWLSGELTTRAFEAHIVGVLQSYVAAFGRETTLGDLDQIMTLYESIARD